MNAAELAAIVVPVFIFIGIGIAVVRAKILPPRTGDVMGDFVFTIAVPALIFRSIGTLSVPEFAPWPFWAAYFAAAGINVAVASVLCERVFRRDPVTGVVAATAASFSNTVMVGVPIVSRTFGEEGLVILLLRVTVHLPVMMAISAVLIEFATFRSGGRAHPLEAARRVATSLAQNPIIIAIALGFAFRLSGLPLDGIARSVVDQLAQTAVPLALIALGMSLSTFPVRGNLAPAAVLTALKLVLMPAVVFVLARHVAGLPPLPVAVLVITAACPTGINAYLIATKYRAGEALSANTITLSTAASLVTFIAWLALLR